VRQWEEIIDVTDLYVCDDGFKGILGEGEGVARMITRHVQGQDEQKKRKEREQRAWGGRVVVAVIVLVITVKS
jgi:hypothetical protein